MILGKLTANLHSFPGGLLTCDLFFRRWWICRCLSRAQVRNC
jgi:hypothetical protein